MISKKVTSGFMARHAVIIDRLCDLGVKRDVEDVAVWLSKRVGQTKRSLKKVVARELHDRKRILVRIFLEVVRLSIRVLDRCAGHLASHLKVI